MPPPLFNSPEITCLRYLNIILFHIPSPVLQLQAAYCAKPNPSITTQWAMWLVSSDRECSRTGDSCQIVKYLQTVITSILNNICCIQKGL